MSYDKQTTGLLVINPYNNSSQKVARGGIAVRVRGADSRRRVTRDRQRAELGFLKETERLFLQRLLRHSAGLACDTAP